jgi:hypothetical protein
MTITLKELYDLFTYDAEEMSFRVVKLEDLSSQQDSLVEIG